ncbi:MAG: Minf_1886 family protein [Gemmatimonadota bacterium]
MQPPVHEINEIIAQLCRRNPKYATKAYIFVLEALHRRMLELDAPRHIAGPELAGAVRDLAIKRFGLLARTVLEHWGVHATSDLGEIVFAMVDYGVLTKEDTDSREDFEGLFSFERVFEAEYPWGR